MASARRCGNNSASTPSWRLRRLHHAILAGDPALDDRTYPAHDRAS